MKEKNLMIVGLGLIGASIALAARKIPFSKNIIAYDKNAKALDKAKTLNIIDDSTVDLITGIKNADFIILATPISALTHLFKTIAQYKKSTAIITDVCSIKTYVVEQAELFLKNQIAQFVPAHPVAGSEKSGLAAARADLFKNHLVVLTPDNKTDPEAIATVKFFWENLGAKTAVLTAAEHDAIFAATSHLPQLLVYTFMAYMKTKSLFPEILQFTGSGFADFTRLAASNPPLWVEIAIHNRTELGKEIKKFKQQLDQLEHALAENQTDVVLEIFQTAQQAKLNVR